jgi:hypothetical protein
MDAFTPSEIRVRTWARSHCRSRRRRSPVEQLTFTIGRTPVLRAAFSRCRGKRRECCYRLPLSDKQTIDAGSQSSQKKIISADRAVSALRRLAHTAAADDSSTISSGGGALGRQRASRRGMIAGDARRMQRLSWREIDRTHSSASPKTHRRSPTSVARSRAWMRI